MRRLIFLVITALLVSVAPYGAVANDLAVWDKLQGTNPKGYVLLMRHALAPGVGDPTDFKLGDCSTQRNLSEQGRQEAQKIGDWLKRRELSTYRVESSRWCRARETAKLLGLGRVIPNENLDSLFQSSDPEKSIQTANIRKKIKKYRQTRGLLILVGHSVNISALTGLLLDSGEGVLVRADKQGVIKVVGRSPNP